MLFTVASAVSVIVRADAMLENSGHWELRGSDRLQDQSNLIHLGVYRDRLFQWINIVSSIRVRVSFGLA